MKTLTVSEKDVILPFEKPKKEFNVEKLSKISRKPIYSFVKRLFDIVASTIALILLFIPMLIVYIVLLVTSRDTPIYKQERLGKDGKRFYIYKFRTMYPDAEKDGAQWSIGEEDERVTPIGKVLRRFKFDEVPQFFNCIKGDLSLVGPRPEREIFYDCFETYIHGFSQRLLVKPGLTGLAQINGGYLKPEEKIIYDIEYIKNRSVRLDFKIMLLTAFAVIANK